MSDNQSRLLTASAGLHQGNPTQRLLLGPEDHILSAEQAAEEPLARYDVVEAGKPGMNWELTLYADHLCLEAPDTKRRYIEWAERHERVQAHDRMMLVPRVLLVKLGKKNVMFQLEPQALAAVKAWIGPPTIEDLKVSLKRRLSWVLPIGILFVFTALPVGGLPWEPVSFGLGLALLLSGLLSKAWPHRIFFALESLWFCSLAANSIWLLADGWSWMQSILLLLQLVLAWRGFQEYHRFAPNRMAPPDDPRMQSA